MTPAERSRLISARDALQLVLAEGVPADSAWQAEAPAASRRPPAARMPSVEELVEIGMEAAVSLSRSMSMREAVKEIARAVHAAASTAQPKES